MSDLARFRIAFEALTGHAPFPWQVNLFNKWFAKGKVPPSCSLPTGLGKTNVIAIWLIALAYGECKLPRRLVYVVNRRTVVDQATGEAEKLRTNLQKPELAELAGQLRRLCTAAVDDGKTLPLAISTLRGQFADNGEWSADPARPAIIVGTVDMIGSRLLFSGYGRGFKTRPLHAGFLGQDALLVHDEAHLEPAFQELLIAIEKEQREGERTEEMPWPKLRVMELSATSRKDGAEGQEEEPFELTDAEKEPPDVIPDPPTEPIHHVWRRQKAKKAVQLHENQDEKKLADEIAAFALKHKDSGRAVLVFVRKVEDVEKIVKKLPKDSLEQLTGTLRGLERDDLVRKPIFQRFLPESNRDRNVATADGTVYLVCTSAGEVGVNISADHLVCDLSTFESMTQRFGRVNRFGDRDDTRIDIVHPTSFGKEGKIEEIDQRRQETLALFKQLNSDGSPFALGKLDPEARLAAFAPPPTILPTSDILFDAWALTTIREKLPGRPPVEPYLHGISDWEPPETQVAWREEVDVITGELLDRYRLEDLLEDYPLKPHELLRNRSDRLFDELAAISKRTGDDTAIWIVEERGQVEVTTLGKLLDADKKVVVNRIAHCTVLLSPSVGGLSDKGTLDGKLGFDPDHTTGYDIADEWFEDKDKTIRRRVRIRNEDPKHIPPKGMRLIRTIDTDPSSDEDESNEPTGRRYWHWYSKPLAADDDLTKTFTEPIKWDHHTNDVTENTKRIVEALALPSDLQQALTIAAKLHDLGKKREVWQRSIGNPNPTDWHAKSGRDPVTGKLWKPRDICPDYRHEFGSLLDVLDPNQPHHAELLELSHDMQDLVLHLIAVHHGRGRPHFPQEEAFDPEPMGRNMTAIAIEAPRWFARMQRKYGRWGLAYLESLLRAADWAASASPSAFVEKPQEDQR